MNSDLITMNDLVRLFCVDGIRRAFERSGLDLQHFIENGATEAELRGHGFDAVLNRVILRKSEVDPNGR